MKAKAILFSALALSGFTFTSCDKDNDDNYTPDQEIVNVLNTMYPNAQRVEWELKNGYHVADFTLDGIEKETWISQQATWVMTESDLTFNTLPEAVQNGFKKGEYKDWKIEDIDFLERTEIAPVYVIEVEQGNQEIDLFYAEDGILVKAVIDTDNDEDSYLPGIITEEIKTAILARYPGAILLDAETDKGIIEIDIRHDNINKEVHFNNQNEWLYTSWEVLLSQVPAIVTDALELPEYAGYTIEDEVDFEERTSGVNVYIFELEKNDTEIHVTVDAAGNIIK